MLRILHLVGSPVSTFWEELSLMYARRCLSSVSDPARYEDRFAHVAPDGAWRLPADLDGPTLADAEPLPCPEALARIAALDVDAMVPQLYCLPGMTDYRALFDVLGVPYVGNRPDVMALAAHKARTKAVVAGVGVRVPGAVLVGRGDPVPAVALPAVVKPADADNSLGVTLVCDRADLGAAVDAALAHSGQALVEDFVELGSEVRCGVLDLGGRLLALPVEDYPVDGIRGYDDKLSVTEVGALTSIGASDASLLAADDPLTARVQEAARRCHTALGCRDYSLFDFRIDPAGEPWFIEAGLYCSFSEHSVVARTAAAAGIPPDELYATALDAARDRSFATPGTP